jgi:hypothetical protein
MAARLNGMNILTNEQDNADGEVMDSPIPSISITATTAWTEFPDRNPRTADLSSGTSKWIRS